MQGKRAKSEGECEVRGLKGRAEAMRMIKRRKAR